MKTLSRWLVLALLALFVASFCFPLLGYMFPRHIEERRLGNSINEELNRYLTADPRFGRAQSWWSASAGRVTFYLHGVTDEDKQQAVCERVARVKANRGLDIAFRLVFRESRDKPERTLRTAEL